MATTNTAPETTAAEAWSELESAAFYEGMEAGASPTFKAYRTAQRALLRDLQLNDPIQASGVPVRIAEFLGEGPHGEPTSIMASEDGKPIGPGWCECDDDREEVYYEDLISRSHGYACQTCRKITQTG